jgi:uncharacterized protein YodC (DUF2158 family)
MVCGIFTFKKDMRIKINDKIYRLKEIESGVDSLMELVEEPKFKDGDFVYEDGRIMIVEKYPNFYKAMICPSIDDEVVYNRGYGLPFSSPSFRFATEEEKKLLLDALEKDGAKWNAEKKCIEDIRKRKFKAGDKVKLKSGCTSNPNLTYYSPFDKYIGKELIVIDYTESGNVKCNNGLSFAEDWLEPYEELKEGDLAIFWDDDKNAAVIGKYGKFTAGQPFPHSNHREHIWKNALKFESKEQYERLIKGEI